MIPDSVLLQNNIPSYKIFTSFVSIIIHKLILFRQNLINKQNLISKKNELQVLFLMHKKFHKEDVMKEFINFLKIRIKSEKNKKIKEK